MSARRHLGRLVAAVGVIVGGSVASAARADLFVYSGVQSQILRFDVMTGQLLGPFAPGAQADDMTFGPDGNLYVANTFAQTVERYSGANGASLGTFAPVAGPFLLAFGPDGNLYVATVPTQSILRFAGGTGAPLGTFATGGGPFVLTFGGLAAVPVPALTPGWLVLMALSIAIVAWRLLRAA